MTVDRAHYSLPLFEDNLMPDFVGSACKYVVAVRVLSNIERTASFGLEDHKTLRGIRSSYVNSVGFVDRKFIQIIKLAGFPACWIPDCATSDCLIVLGSVNRDLVGAIPFGRGRLCRR